MYQCYDIICGCVTSRSDVLDVAPEANANTFLLRLSQVIACS